LTINPGIWVRQAIANTPKSFEKYANIALEKWSFQEMIDVWSEVTGKKGVFVECSPGTYETFWGAAGHELYLQFKFGEQVDPWAENEEFISAQELGIDEKEVVGFRGTIERLKSFF
jgi:hypothetical protein